MATIEFFYDVVSPYSFIAFEILVRNAKTLKYKLTLRPFFLGAVMSATGNKPPATVHTKGVYMLSDLARVSEFHNLDTPVLPDKFPINTLKAQRILTVIEKDYPELLVEVSRSFWRMYWLNKKPIDEDEIIAEILNLNGISTPSEVSHIMTTASSAETKARLKAATDEAVSKGAFGAPAMFATKAGDSSPALFFGHDRIELMFFYLGLLPKSSL